MAGEIEIKYLSGPRDPEIHDFDLIAEPGALTIIRIAAEARIQRNQEYDVEVDEFDSKLASIGRHVRPQLLSVTLGSARGIALLLADYHTRTADDIAEFAEVHPDVRESRGNRAGRLYRQLSERLDFAEIVLDFQQEIAMRSNSGS